MFQKKYPIWLAVFLLLVIIILVWALCFNATWLIFAHWVYDFQTLITGLLAVAAAISTIWITNRNIKQNRRSQHTVSRALATSEISAFSHSIKNVVDFLEVQLPVWMANTSSSGSDIHVSFDSYQLDGMPELNTSILNRVAELIDGLKAKDQLLLSDFVSRIQICKSRLISLPRNLECDGHGVSEAEFYSRIIDLLILDTYGMTLLKYCRDPSLKVLPSLPEKISISQIFSSNLLYNNNFNNLLGKIKWPPIMISERQREID